jgi:hypothetical protein
LTTNPRHPRVARIRLSERKKQTNQ